MRAGQRGWLGGWPPRSPWAARLSAAPRLSFPPSQRSDHSRAIGRPSLRYLHLQRGGAVLPEHRVGQPLQKSILLAHQLPGERRGRCPSEDMGSGLRPTAATTPRMRAPAHRAPFTERRLRQAPTERLRPTPCPVSPLCTCYFADPPLTARPLREAELRLIPGLELSLRPETNQKPEKKNPPRAYWLGRPSASESSYSDWGRIWLSRPPPLPEQRAQAPRRARRTGR